MADGTSFHPIEDTLRLLQESMASHGDRLDSLHAALSNQQKTISDLMDRLEVLDGRFDQASRFHVSSPQESPRFSAPLVPLSYAIPTRAIHLDFPRFDGLHPLDWIFKAERFFDYHSTADDQRLFISSLHMDGDALQWFKGMYRNAQLSSWPVFTRALELRFGPPEFDDPHGTLAKLKQTTTVSHYQSQFEALANRTVGLSPSFLVNSFVTGLRSDICSEVVAFQPTCLSEAMALARVQEAKLPKSNRSFLHMALPKGPLLPLLSSGLAVPILLIIVIQFYIIVQGSGLVPLRGTLLQVLSNHSCITINPYATILVPFQKPPSSALTSTPPSLPSSTPPPSSPSQCTGWVYVVIAVAATIAVMVVVLNVAWSLFFRKRKRSETDPILISKGSKTIQVLHQTANRGCSECQTLTDLAAAKDFKEMCLYVHHKDSWI